MSDERTLLAGTVANVIGLIVGVAAAVGVQILLGRALVPGAFGVVTVAVQVAFVASAGSRFGMDMAAVRLVAIGRGANSGDHVRSLVNRCAVVALVASSLLAAALAASAPVFGDYDRAIALAALGIPFIALTSVYLGATRGLTQMRQTLYVFWIGQPVVWITLAGGAIAVGGGTDAVVLTYGASWLLASLAAWALWHRESRPFDNRPATRGEVRDAIRYGIPRAPAASTFGCSQPLSKATGSTHMPRRLASRRCCCSSSPRSVSSSRRSRPIFTRAESGAVSRSCLSARRAGR